MREGLRNGNPQYKIGGQYLANFLWDVECAPEDAADMHHGFGRGILLVYVCTKSFEVVTVTDQIACDLRS